MAAFLLNILVAVLAFILADYILARVNVTDPLKTVIALIVAVLAFLAGIGGRLT